MLGAIWLRLAQLFGLSEFWGEGIWFGLAICGSSLTKCSWPAYRLPATWRVEFELLVELACDREEEPQLGGWPTLSGSSS